MPFASPGSFSRAASISTATTSSLPLPCDDPGIQFKENPGAEDGDVALADDDAAEDEANDVDIATSFLTKRATKNPFKPSEG